MEVVKSAQTVLQDLIGLRQETGGQKRAVEVRETNAQIDEGGRPHIYLKAAAGGIEVEREYVFYAEVTAARLAAPLRRQMRWGTRGRPYAAEGPLHCDIRRDGERERRRQVAEIYKATP